MKCGPPRYRIGRAPTDSASGMDSLPESLAERLPEPQGVVKSAAAWALLSPVFAARSVRCTSERSLSSLARPGSRLLMFSCFFLSSETCKFLPDTTPAHIIYFDGLP